MAPERQSEKKNSEKYFLKTLKVFFLKTLRSILSKLWEVLSQNSMASERHPKKLWKFFFPSKLWEVFSQNSEKYFSKLSSTRTPFKKLWKFFPSKLWGLFSQNSMAPERHSKKLWKFFFSKTLRSISSKLWEGFSQNSEKHFLKTKGTRVPLWKLFPPRW